MVSEYTSEGFQPFALVELIPISNELIRNVFSNLFEIEKLAKT
jgi:hypothetical protein